MLAELGSYAKMPDESTNANPVINIPLQERKFHCSFLFC